MIKHLIFDFGGVFLDLGGKHTGIPEHLARIFNIPEEKAAEIWKENKADLLRGKETPKDFLIKMNSFAGTSVDPEKAHQEWISINKMEKSRINRDLVEYVESLKGKYQIHMLTDTINLDSGNSDWLGDISKVFHNIYRSFETGYRKPDKEAFIHVLEKINAKPEECIFVDDLQANVDAANELGIKGILYTSFEKLKKDFTDINI